MVTGSAISVFAKDTMAYLVNSNTNGMRNYPASLYGYPVLALTRISGWNA